MRPTLILKSNFDFVPELEEGPAEKLVVLMLLNQFIGRGGRAVREA